MALARDINIKPSCVQELHGLPGHMTRQIWEKLTFLAQDPIPDGRLKKKLEQYRDIYRLRIGDYRVFYTFGSDWIRLLAIRRRSNAYDAQDIRYEEPDLVPDSPDLDDTTLLDGSEAHPPWQPGQAVQPRPLPGSLSGEWLTGLRIPAQWHAALLACTTEDELLAVQVPAEYVERVIENLFPRPIQEIMKQPDLAVFRTEDLVRYKEGDLIGFLLRLDSEQERLVDWALRGPALIKGGPGTGKSTIALYRVRSLLDHAERTGLPLPSVLFTTYTPALTRFSEQLLQQLLAERMNHVRVETADALARRIVEAHEHIALVAERTELEVRLSKVLEQRRGRLPGQVASLRAGYLLDEIEWVIEGRNLQSVAEYLAADRTGRGVGLSETARRAVWDVYTDFAATLIRAGLWTPSRIRVRALELVRSGAYAQRFDAVMIDEAQDLTPTSLSLLVELAREASGVYLTADASQSIYFRGFTWQSVHERLRFRGRAMSLRRNYRSTREIADAAADFVRGTGAGDPDSLVALSSVNGPQPVLLGFEDEAAQWQHTAEYIRQMARHLRLKPSAAAVLIPSGAVGEQAEAALCAQGLKARYMRGSQLNLQSDEVKVLRLQAAKGLEFPIVVVAGLTEKQFPRLPAGLDPEEREEELQAARRTLFVGMTRAMRGLMLIYSRKQPSLFVAELKPQYWYMAQV